MRVTAPIKPKHCKVAFNYKNLILSRHLLGIFFYLDTGRTHGFGMVTPWEAMLSTESGRMLKF
jgi:hypothetical protein